MELADLHCDSSKVITDDSFKACLEKGRTFIILDGKENVAWTGSWE